MDRPQFYALTAFFFFALALYVVYAIVSPFLVPLGWAAVIGVLTFPLYRRLLSRVDDRPTLAASIMTPAVVLTLVIPVTGLTFFLIHEVTIAYAVLEKVAADGGHSLIEGIQQHPIVQQVITRLEPYTGPLNLEVDSLLLPEVKQVAATVLGYSKEIAKNFFLFTLKLILMVITLFFIYRDGERVQQQVLDLVPLNADHKEMLVETVRRVLKAVMYGVFLTCLVQGALGGLGFWVAGIPAPALFGAIMAVCALVPVVGTGLIWLPASLYLILYGDVAKGVGLMVWGFVVVSSIDNVIRPFFISGRAKLPVLVIAIGGLGGLAAFGVLGAVAGPIVLALLLALFDIYRLEAALEPEEGGLPPSAEG